MSVDQFGCSTVSQDSPVSSRETPMEKKAGGRDSQRAWRSDPSPASSSKDRRPRPPDRPGATAESGESSVGISPSCERGQMHSELPALVGTCSDMCPLKERAERERLRDLSVFERLNGNPGRTSSDLAIKKFCRTISTLHVQPSNVRPLQVLQRTLEYLLSLMESSEHPFEVVHDFVFDRTRSIRQDLSMQNIINDQAIYMYEEMVKFHVTSHCKLAICCGNSSIFSSRHLNMEQLLKCLLSLFDMYAVNRRFKPISKNEAEFYSFYVLLHLGRKNSTMGESLSSWFRKLPLPILRAKEMLFARNVLRYYRMGNYKRFFNTIAADSSHLQLCLVEPFLDEVRAEAMSYISYGGYKLHPYPLNHLSRLLMIKEKELDALCSECGFQTSTDGSGSKNLPPKQVHQCLSKERMRSYRLCTSDF